MKAGITFITINLLIIAMSEVNVFSIIGVASGLILVLLSEDTGQTKEKRLK